MAAPAFGSAGTDASTFATSLAVPVPTGVAAGDIVLVHVHRENNDDATGLDTGFAAVDFGSGVPSAGTIRQYVYWKRATAGDSGTYTFTWAVSGTIAAVATRWTGCLASGTPYEAVNAAARASSGATTPAVSLTTLDADRRIVWTGSTPPSVTWTQPTSYTEHVDSPKIGVASIAQAVAGSTGSITGTASVADFQNATLLALVPAAVPVTERFAPDAILAQTGLTGAVAAIQDDPDSPDGSWLVA